MNEFSNYQQIAPKSDKLRGLIKLYYVHTSNNEDATEKSTYFPNYTTTINIYRNSKVSWTETSRTHETDHSSNFLKLLVSKFDASRETIMKGAFDKLTIVFHPLGLNHFLDIPLSILAKRHFSFFSYFDDTLDPFLGDIFSYETVEEKRDALDEYFLKAYKGFEEVRMVNAVEQILKTSGSISIEALSSQLNISRKTLLRLFKKHLSYSPSEYKSIVKFRKAVETYQTKSIKQNFSSLAHENFYYDQSDLNFHFKDKTGLTPQQLFAEMRTIDQGLYWKSEHVPNLQDSKK